MLDSLMQGHSFCFYVTFDILVTGVEKLMKTYSGNPSFSNQKNLEETEQQLEEVKCSVCRVGPMDVHLKSIIKIDLLECSLMSCCL